RHPGDEQVIFQLRRGNPEPDGHRPLLPLLAQRAPVLDRRRSGRALRAIEIRRGGRGAGKPAETALSRPPVVTPPGVPRGRELELDNEGGAPLDLDNLSSESFITHWIRSHRTEETQDTCQPRASTTVRAEAPAPRRKSCFRHGEWSSRVLT